jgi:prepilin-type N-terminal cleavage/methylation domain-containing protein
MRPTRQAFTLFELMLTMALLVVLAAISYPSLDAMYGTFKVTAATDTVRGAWAQGRARAMNDGRVYRFSVVPNKGNYRLAPDSADFWAGDSNAAQASDPGNPPLVLEGALPKGVRFSLTKNGPGTDQNPGSDTILPEGSVESSAWSTAVTFLPDGTSREDVELVFQARGAQPVVIKLRGLTGVVTTRTWEDEAKRR